MIAGVGKSQTNLFVHTCVIFSHIVRFGWGLLKLGLRAPSQGFRPVAVLCCVCVLG